MLKQRLLTGSVLVLLFLVILFKTSAQTFFLVSGFIVLLSSYEWSSLLGIRKSGFYFVYPMIVLLFLIASLFVPILIILLLAAAFWFIASILVIFYPRGSSIWGRGVILRGIMGLFVLIPAFRALNFIRADNNGVWALLFLFILVWGADIGAYFAGKKWGRKKLAPRVSPGKTWEGFSGALAITFCITFLVSYEIHLPFHEWFLTILLTFITVIAAVFGDLLESMLKRQENRKDSGRLLPGHGGILDRIDSLTAAAPIYALGALYLGKLFSF